MKIESYKTKNHPLFKDRLIVKKKDRGLWRLENEEVYLLFSSRQINIWKKEGWLVENLTYNEKIQKINFESNKAIFDKAKLEVSKNFGVKITDIVSTKSNRDITEARHSLVYICKIKTTLGNIELKNLVKANTVEAIKHGAARIKDRIEVETPFDRKIKNIINAIRE